ncbi:hypothetical protein GDO78_001677 [Eleutherodactylus coqui]|uniref:Uncharacterized protein n=1 Tax=Eleutherodactylus coqui TaxID=57060 RepID=A0A8J6FW64_ELECQ|nr:hypothetical protein GDO78_001677 [Eleutherodactylus coqui]
MNSTTISFPGKPVSSTFLQEGFPTQDTFQLSKYKTQKSLSKEPKRQTITAGWASKTVFTSSDQTLHHLFIFTSCDSVTL